MQISREIVKWGSYFTYGMVFFFDGVERNIHRLGSTFRYHQEWVWDGTASPGTIPRIFCLNPTRARHRARFSGQDKEISKYFRVSNSHETTVLCILFPVLLPVPDFKKNFDDINLTS